MFSRFLVRISLLRLRYLSRLGLGGKATTLIGEDGVAASLSMLAGTE